jgi:hypothetical protein
VEDGSQISSVRILHKYSQNCLSNHINVGAYAIDDDLSIFRLIIASMTDIKSFNKQCLQLDTATRDHLTTRLDYYQVNIDIDIQY